MCAERGAERSGVRSGADAAPAPPLLGGAEPPEPSRRPRGAGVADVAAATCVFSARRRRARARGAWRGRLPARPGSARDVPPLSGLGSPLRALGRGLRFVWEPSSGAGAAGRPRPGPREASPAAGAGTAGARGPGAAGSCAARPRSAPPSFSLCGTHLEGCGHEADYFEPHFIVKCKTMCVHEAYIIYRNNNYSACLGGFTSSLC